MWKSLGQQEQVLVFLCVAWRGGQTSGVVSSGLGKQNWFHAFVADGPLPHCRQGRCDDDNITRHLIPPEKRSRSLVIIKYSRAIESRSSHVHLWHLMKDMRLMTRREVDRILTSMDA